jgi:hypothetical protein
MEPSATAEAAPAAALAPEPVAEERTHWLNGAPATVQEWAVGIRKFFARGNPDQSMQSTCTTSPSSRTQERKAAQNAARKARVKAAKARKRAEAKPGVSALRWDVDDDWGDVGEGCDDEF